MILASVSTLLKKDGGQALGEGEDYSSSSSEVSSRRPGLGVRCSVGEEIEGRMRGAGASFPSAASDGHATAGPTPANWSFEGSLGILLCNGYWLLCRRVEDLHRRCACKSNASARGRPFLTHPLGEIYDTPCPSSPMTELERRPQY